jgi:hypothetical protein
MPQAGFEPTIQAFERAKTLHALDRAATVIGHDEYNNHNYATLSLIWKPDIATELTQSTSSHSIPNVFSKSMII